MKDWPMSFLSLAWRDRFRRKPVRERSSRSLLVRRRSSSTGSMRSCSRDTRLSTEAHCRTRREKEMIQMWDQLDYYIPVLYKRPDSCAAQCSPSCLQLWCSAGLQRQPHGWWRWSHTDAAHGCTHPLSEGATATPSPLAHEQPQWK